ncbi:uncharacterized protein LOC127082464 [Lathyrus oleraceus]|uniref:uncharacterized protein LOC127082464 n=1 Tax=Pisum sativum TaxID=3888 RepID=UPI0021CDFB32|nr:uncharacterized protein LOC127082464 [Pisum sativum]
MHQREIELRSVGIDVDLSEVIIDVVPISMVPGHETPIRKPRTTTSRKGKPSKASTSPSSFMVVSDVKNIELSTFVKKPHSMISLSLDPINDKPNVDAYSKVILFQKYNVDKNIRVLISQVLGIEHKTGVVSDVSTSLAQTDNPIETPQGKSNENVSTQSPEKSEEKDDSDGMSGDLSNKEENSREKKDQSIDTVNVGNLDYDDEPIGKKLALGIAKRLRNRKGKAVVTPVSKKRSPKRKEVPYGSSVSDCDVEHDVQDIISATTKQTSGKKIPTNILEILVDNISFHFVENVEKWKFVYQRIMALERELEKVAFECKETISLIQEAGLMKSVTGFDKCYEMLVKDFIVNISKERDNNRNKEFRKVYVRGRCMNFALEIINRLFMGKHVLDIVMTSGQKPTDSTTETGILDELKDTCKTLDETIKGLRENLEGDNADEEGAKEEGANTSDDEETTNIDED